MQCPGDATLAAFTEGLCRGEERDRIEGHLDDCNACRVLVGALARARTAESVSDDPDEPPESSGSPRPGSRLGRYHLLRPIGEGGMGVVFAAHDPQLDREVAIKLLHSGPIHESRRRRLRAEAEALARLSHPNVVNVFELGEADDHTFVVMELVDGEPLSAWQARRPSWRECVRVYAQAGRGLAASHEQGLVHRDFKPSNCILDHSGRVRVLDFGLAHFVREPTSERSPFRGDGTERSAEDSSEPLTKEGAILGTLPYMPLEQLHASGVDAKSDQWAFCASLFEAIYGRRPFEMPKTLMARVEQLAQARPRSGWRVRAPLGLRRVLVRGLSAEPEDRWPSMETLLAALERYAEPRRTRWRWLPVGLLAGSLGAAIALRGEEAPAVCTSAETRLEGVWDESARARVRDGLLATEASYAAATWERLEPRLDDYAARWIEAHASACLDSHERKIQSPEQLDARMGCLDERRRELRALVEVLAESSTATVTRAVSMAEHLPSIDGCADLELVVRRIAPPEPGIATAVEEHRERVAVLSTRLEAGEYEQGLVEIGALRDEAVALGYRPLLVEVAFIEGQLQLGSGRVAEAVDTLEWVFFDAGSLGHGELQADAAIGLVTAVGQGQYEPDAGMVWVRHAEAYIDEVNDTERRARLTNARAGIETRRGHFAEAIDLFRQAADMTREAFGPEHPDTAKVLYNLAVVLLETGQLEQAEEILEGVVRIEEDVLGPAHPKLAQSLNALSAVANGQGDDERTKQLLERALAVQQEALGSSHPSVAVTLNNLALMHVELGNHAEATELLRRALAIREQTLGPDNVMVAFNLVGLADAELRNGRVDEAERLAKRALSIQEASLGAEHPELVSTLETLGWVHRARGEHEQAREILQRAVTLAETTLGPENPTVGAALINLGKAHVGLGDRATALQIYRRALTVLEQAHGPEHPRVVNALVAMARLRVENEEPALAIPDLERVLRIDALAPASRAEARLTLAQAVDSAQGDRARACTLVEQARADTESIDIDIDEWIERVEAWKERCAP